MNVEPSDNRVRLYRVLHPYESVDSAPGIEDLLHEVGQLQRCAESAHVWLDMEGIPREDPDGGVLTLRGRLEKMGDRKS